MQFFEESFQSDAGMSNMDDSWMEQKVDFDPKLLHAHEVAIESGRLTPLIKEELWTKIQARRLSSGLSELHVEFNKPVKNDLTEEEQKRVDMRRLKNREAAKRCRVKRKIKKEETLNELDQLILINRQLKEKVELLEKEIEYVLMNLKANDIYPATTEPVHDIACFGNCAADKEVEQTLKYSPGFQIPVEDKAQIVPTTPEIWNVHGPYFHEIV
ncbi:hypothetical protein KUTeg_013751 [Tegillarca granosa]|uniref:BZIP domain-containing protein n=1 Tax=Tegillarca granosa TaxID=220873 RepID=A0ABQ9EZ35_TEGGR|nr:hypothetical protein KUTeg_013751 [Tegillarca granosa]